MNKQKRSLFCLLVSVVAYFAMGYFTPRIFSFQLLTVYSILFACYFLFVFSKTIDFNFKQLFLIAILFRAIFLFSVPALSDDFYRFIWDGLFFADGTNPYLVLPSSAMQDVQYSSDKIYKWLYGNMNSQNYFTVYPPLCQYIFGLSCRLFPANLLGAIVTIRLFILLFEAGTILMLWKLLENHEKKTVLVYAFNPLVIIELTGNLHFEAVMIFFILLSVYFLRKNKSSLSAISMGLAAGTKLLPLIFLPLIVKRLGWKKFLSYCFIVGVTLFVLFLPFYNFLLFENLFSSIELYFSKFEFNASIYYVVRWIGFKLYGYNIIETIGPLLALTIFASVVIIASREKETSFESFAKNTLLILLVYFAMATTVHPWYISTLIAFSCFHRSFFALVWSACIPFTYLTYATFPYHEALWITAIEYILVFSTLMYDFQRSKRNQINLNENI